MVQLAGKSGGFWLRVLLGVLAAAACVALVIVGLNRPIRVAKAAPIGARLELAAGEVLVDQGQGKVRLVSGTPLHADARVETAKGARALVRLPDGSSLFLRGGSVVKLGASAIDLESGEYWLSAPPVERDPLVHRGAEVTITAVDAGLSFKREGENVVVYVARGMAVVSAPGGRVEVNAGEQALVGSKAAPKVEAVAFWDDWTGGMADLAAGAGLLGAGSGAIYGVDEGAPAGALSRRLEVKSQTVRAVLREGLCETEVDQTFFNPGERPVEGWYWFNVPERANVTGFAVETSGVLVEGEFIERREAAAKYGVAKASGYSPAILEWVDSHTYRARIYPVPAAGTRRVVVRYFELRPIVDGKLQYVYPMGGGEPVRIGEFSLTADLGDAGKRMTIATLADARVEDGGKRVTMRRSGYTPRADFQFEATMSERRPTLAVARFATGGQGADYVMARYVPDIDWSRAKEPRGEVVVVVDTSAGGDEANRQLEVATAEAILRSLSDEDRFALVSLDVKPTVLHPDKALAPASEAEIARALEKLAEHSSGGATDLASSFDVALERVHGSEQPAVIYVGDGLATSGEMSGEQLVERLRRALATSRARLFTVAVGHEADHSLLGELARAGGGTSFRVDDAGETTAQALELAAAVKVPTITDFEIDLGAGLDEPFVSTSGKVSRGDEVIVLARTHHELPNKVKVRGRLGGEPFEKEVVVTSDKSLLGAFVPRLWAAEYVRRLLGSAAGPDEERGRIVGLGIDYGLMTPFTSILALENEAAYRRMNIERRRSKLRGVRLGLLDRAAEQRLALTFASNGPSRLTMGCSKSDPAGASVDEVEQPSPAATGEASRFGSRADEPADNREGGSGTRAKGEEGSMGNPNTRVAPAAAPVAGDVDMPAAPPPAEAEASPAAQPATETADVAKARPSPGRAAPAGAADRPEPRVDPTARQAALREAAQLGMIGLLSATIRNLPPLALATCSDVAQRPLPHRVLLWKKRLATAKSAEELLERYVTAWRACELPDWQAERTFLKLLQERISDEGTAAAVLAYFASRPEVQKHIGQLILRRAVDDRVVAAVERVLFGSAVDWNKLDLDLAAIETLEERIATLRERMALSPDDPNGDIRLVRLLVQAGRADEALAIGRRLRDRGFMTLRLARQLGDVLARADQKDEAVRAYSEIVEFDPHNVDSRRLLGDIFLAHGWYEPAYRQFRTITEEAETDALGWMRLAIGAAGAGRVDEALRLARKVASAPGRPGPEDPRPWGKLLAAAWLSELVAKPPAGKLDAVKRELKELQIFRGPATLVVLTWQDLGSELQLVARAGDQDVSLGEVTDGARTGLSAALLAPADFARAAFVARLRTVPRDDAIRLVRHDITWTGKDFEVRIVPAELAARATEQSL